MATKVKGITIELTADTSGLEQALKSANKELASTQRQLNSVNKALKLDPGNTELIEQKQRLLAKAIDQTKTKLEALKRAQASIDTKSESGQAQYDALTREISDTTVKLKQLNKEQQQFNTDAQSSTTGTSALSAGLSKAGAAAGAFADKTRGISMAAAGALAALGGLAVKAGQMADEWLTLSQQTGLSTDAIQKFAYAADLVDVDLSTIVGAITKMKGNLDKIPDVWQKIGVQVRNQSGQYRDIESIFNDTVKALGNIKNETERDTLAMKVFGKSANELAGILDDGGAKMRALGQEAQDMGVIVSKEDLQALGEFNDALDKMKAQLTGALAAAAVPIVKALLPVITTVSEKVKNLASLLSKLPQPVLAVIGVALVITALLSPVAMGISLVCNALNMLITTLPAVGVAIGQMVSTASAFVASNPYVGVILAIIAALAALAFAIYEIIQHWDQLSAAGRNAFNALTAPAQNILSVVKAVAEGIISGMGGIPGIIQKVASSFSQLSESARGVAQKVISTFQELENKARNAGRNMIKGFADGITSVINSVVQAVQRLASAIQNVWNSITNNARTAGSQAASAYASGYNNTSSTARLSSFNTSNGGSYSASASLLNSSGAKTLASSIDTLSTNLSAQSTPVTVNVELVGSAKNIFETVRVENNTLATATGYHALA